MREAAASFCPDVEWPIAKVDGGHRPFPSIPGDGSQKTRYCEIYIEASVIISHVLLKTVHRAANRPKELFGNYTPTVDE
jgi:hypothetical protein